MTEENIAATYALIYRFLKQQSQGKAADAVKKAAKPFVVLRDDVEQKGPSLQDIIKKWKTSASTNSEDTDSSPEDLEPDDTSSDSEDDSSSNSSSEDSEDTSGSGTGSDCTSDSDGDSAERRTPQKPSRKPVERDTSVTLSSAGDHTQEVVNQVAQIPGKPIKSAGRTAAAKSRSAKSDSSDSESDGSSESSVSDDSDADSTSSSAGSSSSLGSSNKANGNEQPLRNKTNTSAAMSQSTSESSSESEDESDSEPQQKKDAHVPKRRKISENKAVATTTAATGPRQIVRPSREKEKPAPRIKERFQRVKITNLAPESLLDNGYAAKGGAVNDYGERAHRELIVTRGAGFRKEKNKKKRGSYRGGEITMESHSIKFDF